MTNLAEATADPALDQPGNPIVEVHPLVDAMAMMNPMADMQQERFHGAGVERNEAVPRAAIGPVQGNVNFNPPGSPLLRPAINPNEPYPDQLPQDDNI